MTASQLSSSLDGCEAVVPCRLLTRYIAKRLVAEVEEARGSTADTASNAKTKLVEAKLEMVRASGLFHWALLFLAFIGSIIVIVFSAMKSTDVYREALARAKGDPAVIEVLGSPIKEGFLVSGNTNVNGASGESNLAIPISGPKGKGTIYVSANKSLGQWNYSGLVVEVAQTHERIDLLRTPAPFNSP